MTTRERKYHYFKAIDRMLRYGIWTTSLDKHMKLFKPKLFIPSDPIPQPVNNLRHRILPQKEILQNIFDSTFGKTSEN